MEIQIIAGMTVLMVVGLGIGYVAEIMGRRPTIAWRPSTSNFDRDGTHFNFTHDAGFETDRTDDVREGSSDESRLGFLNGARRGSPRTTIPPTSRRESIESIPGREAEERAAGEIHAMVGHLEALDRVLARTVTPDHIAIELHTLLRLSLEYDLDDFIQITSKPLSGSVISYHRDVAASLLALKECIRRVPDIPSMEKKIELSEDEREQHRGAIAEHVMRGRMLIHRLLEHEPAEALAV